MHEPESGSIEFSSPVETVEAMEALWKMCTAAPERPNFILVSKASYKQFRRYWNSKRKGHSRFTGVAMTLVVELGIPAGSYENTWFSDVVQIDKRCLRRYKRRARARIQD